MFGSSTESVAGHRAMAVAVSVLSPRIVTEYKDWGQAVKHYAQGAWLEGFIAFAARQGDEQSRHMVQAAEAFTWHQWPACDC